MKLSPFNIGIVAGVVVIALVVPCHGQTESKSLPSSQAEVLLSEFLQERDALMQERFDLIDGCATREQLQRWQQQNASRFEVLQQRALALSQAQELNARPTNRQPNIPPNASVALQEFLTTQTVLANARAQIHNQLLQPLSAKSGELQVEMIRSQSMQIFHQQNAATLDLQRRRAEALAQESEPLSIRVPKDPIIPPNASPELAAVLTQRHALLLEYTQIQNQYIHASPTQRATALRQWREQSAARFEQFQQAAQTLSASENTE